MHRLLAIHGNDLVLNALDKVACLVWWTWRRSAYARFGDQQTVVSKAIPFHPPCRREDAVLDAPGRFSRFAERRRRDGITQLLAGAWDDIPEIGVRHASQASEEAVVWEISEAHVRRLSIVRAVARSYAYKTAPLKRLNAVAA